MSGLTQGNFSESQWAAITLRDGELAVSAAAGSGKTRVLIERIIHRLLGIGIDGQPSAGRASELQRLLVVTFTRKAAGELRERLAQRLSELAGAEGGLNDEGRALARRQLLLLPTARMGTIHGFCSDVIRQYGALLDISPARQIDEAQSRWLEHQLATAFLDRRLDGSDPGLTELAHCYGGPDGVGGDSLEGAFAGRSRSGLRRVMLELVRFRRSLPDPEEWFARHAWPPLNPAEPDPQHPLLLEFLEQLRQWAEQEISAADHEQQFVAEQCPESDHPIALGERKRILREVIAAGWIEAGGLLAQLKHGLDGTEGRPKVFKNRTALSGAVDKLDDESACKRMILAGRKRFVPAAGSWMQLLSAPWHELVQDENRAAELAQRTWRLTADFEAEYCGFLAQRGLRDFAGLERDCLRLVSDQRVAAALRSQLDEILVDEYQDTNELQEAILSQVTPQAATSDSAQRFSVGDIKQSIYAFRLAEPQIFQQLCRRLGASTNSGERHIALNANYRSRRSVVNAVNEVFRGLFTEDFGGEDYAHNELEFASKDFQAKDAAEGEAPARLHIALTDGAAAADDAEVEDAASDEPDLAGEERGPDGDPQDFPPAVQHCVARLLHELHASGRQVYDKQQGQWRRIMWRDIAVLLRSRSGIVELREELGRAGIPYSAAGRSGFYERSEVSDILSLLQVLDNPLQDKALAAVLHGPAGQFSPAELLEIAAAQGPSSASDAADEPADDDSERLTRQGNSLWLRLNWRAGVADALGERLCAFIERLVAWQRAARDLALPDLIWRLFEQAGLLYAAAAQHNGAQRQANLLAFHDMALNFSRTAEPSLTRYLGYIRQDQRAAGDFGEADLPTGDADELQVMTVHQAKGLEFPVVVLVLPGRFNTRDLNDDILWHKTSGVAASYVQLVETDGRPARHFRTLSWRLARAAKLRSLLEEELRVLYVGMTRAREQLEVVLPLKQSALDAADSSSVPAHSACSAWDWFSVQLAHYIANQPMAQTNWLVQPHQPVQHHTEMQAAVEADPADPRIMQAALKLARAEYCGQQQSAPYKLSVSELSKQRRPAQATATPAEADSDGFAILHSDLPGQSPILAGRSGAGRQAALARGTLTHRVMQELLLAGRFSSDCSADDVEAVLDRAVNLTGLSMEDSAGLDCMRLARQVSEICSDLALDGCEIHAELPLSAAMSAAEMAELGIKHPQLPPDSSELVIVQGTLDLLARQKDDSALLLDFKTDAGADGPTLLRHYRSQLKLYSALVERLLPGKQLRWVLYGTDRAGLVWPEGEADGAS